MSTLSQVPRMPVICSLSKLYLARNIFNSYIYTFALRIVDNLVECWYLVREKKVVTIVSNVICILDNLRTAYKFAVTTQNFHSYLIHLLLIKANLVQNLHNKYA